MTGAASTSPPCDRFDRDEAFATTVGRDASAAPDPAAAAHLAACPACQAQYRSYARLIQWIGAPRPAWTPRAGWQEAVLARLTAGDRGAAAADPAVASVVRRKWRPLLWLAAAPAAAAAIVVLLLSLEPRRDPLLAWSPAVQVEIVPDQARRYRSATAAPGDRAAITFATGGLADVELRVFRGAELVHRCPGAEGCRRSDDRLEALVPLAAAGRYEALVVWSRRPLPPPAAGAAADSARVVQAGGRVHVVDVISVR